VAGAAWSLILLDTNIAIDLRDGRPETLNRAESLPGPLLLSFVTRIELESGVFRVPALAFARREALNAMLARCPVVSLIEADVLAYGRIVAAAGFDRRRILDRLIAAQCLTRKASLVTGNREDFADIAGLQLIDW
jgi:tRNA(fMet)-specific endonuclease VapC